MELFVSAATLTRIFAFLLYAPIILISYWKLIPRLSPTGQRIASGFLAAQVLVIVISLGVRPTDFEEWLWKLDRARNIDILSILTSTQLAMVGVVALVTAWLERARPTWQRYLVGMGVVFPYLGLDDFFDWKLLAKGWLKEPYILIGMVVAVATIAAAMRSPRRARIWHLCLLTGLALAAMGGLVVDGFPDICGHLGFFRIDGCLQSRFLEESLEFLGAWLALVAMLGHFSNAMPTPRPRIRIILYAMLAFWILLFLLNSSIPRSEAGLLAQPAPARFEAGMSAAQWNTEPINNDGFTVSDEQLLYIFVFLLYVPIVLISYWKLMPRLSSTPRRLASLMLVAQVLVIILSIGIRPASDFEKWLWDLDQEYNIPSILSSTQLALVAGFALITAWLAKARPAWQRVYLAGIGLVFLFLAWDEFFIFHEHIANWKRVYVTLGAVVAVAVAIAAVCLPRRSRIWHLCLLVGLAISAVGAMLFDTNRQICGSWGFLPINGCLQPYNYGEPLEFLGIWLVLVALLGHFSDAVPIPKPRVRYALYALPALWILLLVHDSFIPDLELRLLAQPASVQFESGVHLHGFRIDRRDGAFTLRLYVSARRRDYIGKGYSVHLVDQTSGNSAASRNKHASRQVGLLFAPGHAHVYRQWMALEIPPQAVPNRALWLVLTLWREEDGEYVHQRVLTSDRQLLDDTQVVLGELVLPAAAATTSVPLAVFDNGFALDAVNLPEHARSGEPLATSFTWRSDVDGDEDHVQFLHFRHEASGDWWVYDQQPLGPRLPTRLWYNGLADRETWQVPLPADLAPGRYAIFTGLYRQSDLERVPASDADGRPFLDARAPLGNLTIE